MVLKLEPFPVNDNHYFGCITVEQNHHYCHNTNSTQPKVGIDNTTHHPPQTQCQQYLSCYLPDFDQTLIVGFWD